MQERFLCEALRRRLAPLRFFQQVDCSEHTAFSVIETEGRPNFPLMMSLCRHQIDTICAAMTLVS